MGHPVMLIKMGDFFTLSTLLSFKDPTTRREEKCGTISLNVLTQLEHGQHVRVEWKGENGAHLYSDFYEKYIFFTGQKL